MIGSMIFGLFLVMVFRFLLWFVVSMIVVFDVCEDDDR